MAGGGPIIQGNNGAADDLPTEGSRHYAIIVCIFASLGGLFFGYDQSVTGSVLVMSSFLHDYCVGWHDHTMFDCTRSSGQLPTRWLDSTLWYNMTYNIGCIFGALLGGWVAGKFGRRMTIFTAGFLFCIGTSWVCFNPAQHHGQLLIARVIQGFRLVNLSSSHVSKSVAIPCPSVPISTRKTLLCAVLDCALAIVLGTCACACG